MTATFDLIDAPFTVDSVYVTLFTLRCLGVVGPSTDPGGRSTLPEDHQFACLCVFYGLWFSQLVIVYLINNGQREREKRNNDGMQSIM